MQIKRAILIHGFNVADGGASTTGLLRAGLEDLGLEVVEFETHWRPGLLRDLLSVRFGNAKRARRLAAIIRPGDLLIGHSNGCALIDQATWLLASSRGWAAPDVAAMYLNPALDVDAPLAPQVKGAWIFHTASDKIVGLASRLWKSRWGSMGRDGYRPGPTEDYDERYSNLSYEHHGIESPGHSGVFTHPAGLRSITWRVNLMLQWLEN